MTHGQNFHEVVLFQQGRPTSSDEGWKMVQQTHLHILLPKRTLLQADRIH